MRVVFNIIICILVAIFLLFGLYLILNFEAISKVFTQKRTPETAQDIEKNSSKFKNDWLYYPTLSISAPVEWYMQTAGDTDKLMATGPVHLNGTATPEVAGEIVIAGHSSYLKDVPGNYKTIFAPLVKAKNDDNIILKRNGIIYFYKVNGIREISNPSNFTAKIGANLEKSLKLITPVPIGTTWRYLEVSANLIRQI